MLAYDFCCEKLGEVPSKAGNDREETYQEVRISKVRSETRDNNAFSFENPAGS